MRLKFKQLHEAAQLPTRANATDSGMDLYAVEDTVLLPGVPTLVKTGLAVELPPPQRYLLEYDEKDPNLCLSPYDVLPITFEAQIRPRSGLALKHGIQVLNSPGTVDNSYRGEIAATLLWSGHAPNAAKHQSDSRILYAQDLSDIWNYHDLASKGFVTCYAIRKGDRIAQLVVAPVVLCGAAWADELSDTARGGGGFGSTGK